MTTNIHGTYSPTYSTDNPVIGWNSATQRGTITATSSAEGYAADNAADQRTISFWRPASLPSEWQVTLPLDETFSYCGIASHNLGGTGCTVTVSVWSGSSWLDRGSITPADDKPILFLFGEYDTTQIRIEVTGTLTPSIGVITFGKALELPRRTYQGYTPIDMAQDVTFTTNYTRGGQLGGRSVQFDGASNKFTVNNIEESWIRANFLEFMESSLYLPFFLAERPEGYPNAIDYMMTTAPIRPTRTGPRNYMSITI